MNEEQIKAITERLAGAFDEVMQQKLQDVVGPLVASETKKIVDQLRLERALTGQDRTGLSEDSKIDFVKQVKAIVRGEKSEAMRVKANEELIEEQDNRGGYLVPKEVANAIVRIAASVGVAMSQATIWPMGTDEKGIPAYTGSFLEGEYLGVNAAGSLTGITFDEANLIVKKWQLAFAVGNDLLADANVNVADWLLSLAGEALANMIDKQSFVGTSPFVGITKHSGVTVYTMATGKDTFAEFDLDEASDIIGSVEESVLDGAAWYFEKSVWAKIRVKKDTAGNYVLPQLGAPSSAMLANYVGKIGGAKPSGEILGYPVFTVRHLPANSATAVSTIFGVFGNLKALAFGDKGEFRVAQHQSGTFGGKEIALADQMALVYKHRHALVVTLPKAFVNIKTAAS